jgi:hypothetical protein
MHEPEVNCRLADGTAADLWSSLGNKCQRWAVIPTGGNQYENCRTANGTSARLWQWLNNNCQEWRIGS